MKSAVLETSLFIVYVVQVDVVEDFSSYNMCILSWAFFCTIICFEFKNISTEEVPANMSNLNQYDKKDNQLYSVEVIFLKKESLKAQFSLLNDGF
jgi:uncharacterized membrane protein